MKKLLSIILAVAMLVGMLPAVSFATESTEGDTVQVTYSFIAKGRTDCTDTWLERVVATTDESTGATTYSFKWNENYKKFPTSSENAGDQWAYLGTSADTAVGPLSSSGYSGFVNLTTYLSVNKCSWTAFRIKVPQTARYSIKKLTAYKYKNASKSMSVSITEMTDEHRTIFTEGNTATYGTAGLSASNYGSRTGAKAYSALGIADDMTLLGTTNIYYASAIGVNDADITNAGTAVLKADTEYLLVLHTGDTCAPTIETLTLEGEPIEPTITTSLSAENLEIDENATLSSVVTDELGEVVTDAEVTYTTEDTDIISISGSTVTALSAGTATVTASATVNGEAVTTTIEVSTFANLTPEYNFTLSAIADDTKTIQDVTSYSQLNTSVSTGKWKFVGYPYISNNLITSYGLQFCSSVGNAAAGNGSLVLNIKVDASGLYNPVINYVKQAYCGRIDIFAIPASLAQEQEWDMTAYAGTNAAIEYCMDANAGKYIASIDMHTDSEETSPKNGNAVYLSRGDNYLIMRIRKGCGVSTHSKENYYGYIESVSFSPADAGLALTLNETIRMMDTPTISASAFDANGEAAEITSITYESLDTDVATIDSTTGAITPVSEGIARIEATATVGEVSNVTASTIVTVEREWNPVYTTNVSAIAEESIQGSTIQCTNVTDYNYIDRSVSTGLWKYETMFNFNLPVLYGADLEFGIGSASNLGAGKNALVLNALVEATGVYDTSISVTPNGNGGVMDVYFVPKTQALAAGYDVSTLENVNTILENYEETLYIGRAEANINVNPSQNAFDGATVKLTEGEYWAVIVLSASEGATGNSSGRYWGLLKNITLDNVASLTTLADSTSIAVGEVTTLQSVARDEYYSTVSADVTYESDNTSVATVSGNVVTAEAAGTAVITATATVDGVEVTDTVEITVTEAAAPKTITLAYSNNIDNEIIVKGRNYVRGDVVTVTAEEIAGYNFRHWVIGTADSGDWVSADAEYTFTLATNTYLTAVYTAATDAKIVEFFNGNGEYITEKEVVDGTVELPEDPSLTGFKFLRWIVAKDTELSTTGITADITRAVAEFIDDGTSYTVDGTAYSYDALVKNTSDTPVAWYRDGVQVGYGTTYNYYVWDKVGEITSDAAGEQKPIVVLDADAKDGGARMIEYDAGGKDIVEVGIIFGDSSAMTVDSCEYKATSQKKLTHGQFTAKPNGDETVALGYLIYEDNGAYRVIYAD